MGRHYRTQAHYHTARRARSWISRDGRYMLKSRIRIRAFVYAPGAPPNSVPDFGHWGGEVYTVLNAARNTKNTIIENAVLTAIQQIAEERRDGKTCRQVVGTWMGFSVNVEVL